MARNFGRVLGEHVDDLLILMGMVVIAVGIWWLYPPLAVIVGGVFLVLIGVSVARQQNEQRGTG